MPTTEPAPRMPLLLGVRVLAWRARHGLRALLVAVLAVWTVQTLAPAPADTVPVVVTGRAVGAGDALTDADLRVVHLPGVAPDGSASAVGQRRGRSPLVDLPAGVPVVDALLTGARFDLEPPEGTVVVPVRLSDGGLAEVVRPGDRIDVVTTVTDEGGTESVELLARRALVVDVREAADEGLGGALAPGPGDPAPTVTVAVRPAEGRRLAASTGWSTLGAVLVP